MDSIRFVMLFIAAFALVAGCEQTGATDQKTHSNDATVETASPRSIRDGRIKAYIAAFSSGAPEQYKAWLEENRTPDALAAAPMDQRLRQYQDDYSSWGRLTVTVLRAMSENVIESDVAAASGETITMVFEFEENPPYRVASLNYRIGGPDGMPPEPIALDDWSDLTDLAQQVHDASGIPAIAIGVYKNGAFETAIAGERKIGGDPALINDAFHWGSVGKSVTGTIIGVLIDRGLIDWNTTIGDVFEEAPMQEDYRDVTIWQLMAHQAGVPAYTMFDEAFGERIKALSGATDAEKRASFVLQILEEPLLFKPGTQAQYSNGGPTIAGRMAEIASGKTWEELVQEFVFDPAHMTTGGFNLPTTSAKPNGISGYYSEAPGEFVELSLDDNILDPDVIAPAGGVHSSIGDFLKYGVTHLEGMRGQDGAVSSATIKALHTPRPGQPKSFGENYTFGWGSRCPFPVTDSLVCQGHNGGGGAYYAQILLLPEENIVIVFMANTTMAAEMVSGPLFQSIVDHYRN